MQEIRVQSVGQEGPLEKEMAIHSSILAWEIPWTEEPGRLYFMGLQRVGHNLATTSPPFYQAVWQLQWFSGLDTGIPLLNKTVTL